MLVPWPLLRLGDFLFRVVLFTYGSFWIETYRTIPPGATSAL